MHNKVIKLFENTPIFSTLNSSELTKHGLGKFMFMDSTLSLLAMILGWSKNPTGTSSRAHADGPNKGW